MATDRPEIKTSISSHLQNQIKGARVAEQRLGWLFGLSWLAWQLGIFLLLPLGAAALFKFNWISAGYNQTTLLIISTILALSATVVFLTIYFKLIFKVLKIKRQGLSFYYQRTQQNRFALYYLLLILLYGGNGFLGYHIFNNFPLAKELKRVVWSNQLNRNNNTSTSIKFYLWGYQTAIDLTTLTDIEFVVPYEKGPPKKLLAKVILKHPSGQLILSGKRPRKINIDQVLADFNNQHLAPRSWPLVYQIQKEANIEFSGDAPALLTLFELANASYALGNDWTQPPTNTKLLFLNSNGEFYQAWCLASCGSLVSIFENLNFNLSAQQPLATMQNQLLKLLSQDRSQLKDQKLKLHENLLRLSLISLITLDPKNPEAYFHLGKLAQNQETLKAALHYAKDTGLEPVKLFELQNLLN